MNLFNCEPQNEQDVENAIEEGRKL